MSARGGGKPGRGGPRKPEWVFAHHASLASGAA